MPLPPLYIPGTNLGCGAVRFRPGFYTLGENFDGRYGGPGPREVIDVTGIAAGYRVVAMCRHVDVPHLATTNGTDTKIYQLDTTWKLIATITSAVAVPNAFISFKSVLAVGFGSGQAYQFATDVTTNGTAYTFSASTKTDTNAERATVFLGQDSGLTAPRVIYAVDPNEIYTTEALTDVGDATGFLLGRVADNSSLTTYITNLVEDYTGEVLICMRHDIYSMDSEGRSWRRTNENFPDGVADAGGQGDRKNFECCAKVNGRLYFNASGYEIVEWYRGNINKYFAPRHLADGLIPRMDLPINALIGVHDYLIVALGTKNTNKSVTYAPGGTAHIGNTIGTTSEIYIGRYEEDAFVYHGVLLKCANSLRFMWHDEDSGYVYMASGDSMSSNLQQSRFLFYPQNPLHFLTSSIVNLNTGTWKVEFGRMDFGDPFSVKVAKHVALHAIGLGVPTLAVKHKLSADYLTTAFATLKTFDTSVEAEMGVDFPDVSRSQFRTMHLELDGVGDASANTYAIFQDLLLTAEAAEGAPRSYPRR